MYAVVDSDVVLAKVSSIHQYVARIRDVQARTDLRPLDVEELLQLNLQRAAQACIDLAAHVVATERWGLYDQAGDTFHRLHDHGVIGDELRQLMRNMVGFRNIAVYGYDVVDPGVVQHIADHHLDDMLDLCTAVVSQFDVSPDGPGNAGG